MINNRIVGLILPSVNVHMEPEFYRMNVPGLNFHATRVMLKETTEKRPHRNGRRPGICG